MNDVSQVTEVAKGISDYGALAIMAAIYLLLSASMMIAIFKWFKSIITQIIVDNKENLQGVLAETRKQNELLNDLAEGLRPGILASKSGLSQTHILDIHTHRNA